MWHFLQRALVEVACATGDHLVDRALQGVSNGLSRSPQQQIEGWLRNANWPWTESNPGYYSLQLRGNTPAIQYLCVGTTGTTTIVVCTSELTANTDETAIAALWAMCRRLNFAHWVMDSDDYSVHLIYSIPHSGLNEEMFRAVINEIVIECESFQAFLRTKGVLK